MIDVVTHALSGLCQPLLDWRSEFKQYLLYQEDMQDVTNVIRMLAPSGKTVHKGRVPIFAHLGKQTIESKSLPLAPLQLKRTVLFPDKATPDPQWESKFITELKAIQVIEDKHNYLISLADIFQRYLWCVPNPYSPKAGTSLWDFCRSVAAVAPALSNEKLSLVSGDISGVQSFIYTITSQKAASSLRGRSLYLQLLTEALAFYVCRSFGLPLTTVLFAGGGHFYLMAPANVDVEALQATITEKLLKHHQGQLYVALASQPVELAQLKKGFGQQVWSPLTTALSERKRRRFSELHEPPMYKSVFQPYGGQYSDVCQVCQYEGPDVKAYSDSEDGNVTLKCDMCQSFEVLGEGIREQSKMYVALDGETAVSKSPRSTWQKVLAEFGYAMWTGSDWDNTIAESGQVKNKQIIVTNLSDDLNPTIDPQKAYRTVYLANTAPKAQGKDTVKDFTQIAEDAEGIKRLGVLRMDVDDLGTLFSQGLGDESNLVRTLSLSWSISLYFSGWVDKLVQKVDEGRNVTYVIYAGGDDLFIVGAWDVMPRLANMIAEDLKAYAVGNPMIHASAGITLHPPKYPLYIMAEEAEMVLESAKDYERQVPTSKSRKSSQTDIERKNAFSFLGQTYHWDTFADLYRQYEHLRVMMIKTNNNKLGWYLQRLYLTYTKAQKELSKTDKTPKVYWGPWHWHSAYQLTRIAKHYEDYEADIYQIRDSLSGDKFHAIEQLGIAARWAELQIRKQNEVNDHG